MKDQIKVELGHQGVVQLSWDYMLVIMIDQTLELVLMLWEKLWVTLPGKELILEQVTILNQNSDLD